MCLRALRCEFLLDSAALSGQVRDEHLIVIGEGSLQLISPPPGEWIPPSSPEPLLSELPSLAWTCASFGVKVFVSLVGPPRWWRAGGRVGLETGR